MNTQSSVELNSGQSSRHLIANGTIVHGSTKQHPCPTATVTRVALPLALVQDRMRLAQSDLFKHHKIMNSTSHTAKLTLKIPRTANLIQCEEVLTQVTTSREPVRLLLFSDNRRVFFRDLRVATIISAASRMPNVECKWHHQISKQTLQSLIGLAASVYGVPFPPGHDFSSLENTKQTLAQRLDILEHPPGTTETLTFSAIDQETRAQPIALSGLSGKKAFETQFGNYVRDYFDYGISSNFSTGIGPSLFDEGPSLASCIFGFVYELYQNTYNHGTLDEHQNIIPGLRIIRLRKRIGNNFSRDAFISGATQFSELQDYFEKTVPQNKSFKFYEISVSDNGMGILSRFRATAHKEYQHSASRTVDLKLLNRIIAQSLSSDQRKSRIGEGGLKKALRAVDTINGFVSLRTDNLWVYRSPTDLEKSTTDKWLRPVKTSHKLSAIPGTHFSMIFLAS